MTRRVGGSPRSDVGRRLTVGAAVVTLAVSGAVTACSDDEEPPSTSLAPTTTAPPESTSSSTPDGDAGGSGAEPGRIPENVDPPGGTTPESESGGSDNDATGSKNSEAGDQTEGP